MIMTKYELLQYVKNEQDVFLSVKKSTVLTTIGRVYSRRGDEQNQTLQGVSETFEIRKPVKLNKREEKMKALSS